jgi:hypothetical protein
MSESVSNIRITPVTHPVTRVRRPRKDEDSDDSGARRERPESSSDDRDNADGDASQDKPLLDEYA